MSPAAHTMPHPPQFHSSLDGSTQPGLEPQQIPPHAAHTAGSHDAPLVHMPCTQPSEPEHSLPHEPQLYGSLPVSTHSSVPVQHVMPQDEHAA